MRRSFDRLTIAGVALLLACGDRAPRVAVIGHRGASADAPEHTWASWDRAAREGADWLEVDLQMTADSALVVLHDETLDRTARGPAGACTGPVRERTLAELAPCNVATWFRERHPEAAWVDTTDGRIPTLDQLLARYGGRARLYIELKAPERAPGMVERFRDALARHDMLRARDALLVQSFSPAALVAFHALAPDVPLIQLLADSIPAARLDETLGAIATWARGIGPSGRIVTPALIAAAHAKGLRVHVYTVNEEAQMRQLVAAGVDGIFTDRPGLLRRVLDTP